MMINTVRLCACAFALLVATSVPLPAEAQPAQLSQKIDLNAASVQVLQTLPGVTPEVANQIIAHRPYASVEQFRETSGLSAVQSEKLIPLVTARPPAPVRQPQLPPGATPISPESFSRGFTPPTSGARGDSLPGPGTTPLPVPQGTVQKVPVPLGTVKEIASPGSAAANPLRDAVLYGVSAIALTIGLVVWMRRTRPARKATRDN